MKRLALLLAGLLSIHAAPTWKGTSTGYVYFGFDGVGVNLFTSATSQDGLTWKNAGGSWSDYVSHPQAGTLEPYQINAPDVIPIGDAFYFHVTSTNDHNYFLVTWIIGRADSSGVVNTLVSVDWTGAIPGVYSCFAGGWARNADGTPYTSDGFIHLHIPCSSSGSASVYETHAALTDLTVWSPPVNVNLAQPNTIDPQVYLINGTFFMWCKDETNRFVTLASSTSITGPYAMIHTGDWAGWGAGNEGPFAYPKPGGGWYLMFERYATDHQMFYSSCSTTLDFAACVWSPKVPWNEDMVYRHGAVLKLQ